MPTFAYEHHHTTSACLKGLADTGRVGALRAVEGGYVLRDPADDRRAGLVPGPHQAVVVRGAVDSALFTAFGWGYGGEGARGLASLLRHLGMDEAAARAFAHDDAYFPSPPAASEFGGKPGFIAYWRLSVPGWVPVRIR